MRNSKRTNPDVLEQGGWVHLLDRFEFSTDHLKEPRAVGISGFMRVKNGAEFLELTIRSHIDLFDELVVVYNQCTDETPGILRRLHAEFGPKLRIYHYLPRVFPPGSLGHAKEPAGSPHSFVNMSNCALSLTRFSVGSKLDDDHLAMDSVRELTRAIRAGGCMPESVLCSSGINIFADERGQIGILAHEPFVGSGDQGYFRVTGDTHFVHDRRFERLKYGDVPREFAGFTYWHLKYLKSGFGFANREIHSGQNPRFERKYRDFMSNRGVLTIPEARLRALLHALTLGALPLSEKHSLRLKRSQFFTRDTPSVSELTSAWQFARGSR